VIILFYKGPLMSSIEMILSTDPDQLYQSLDIPYLIDGFQSIRGVVYRSRILLKPYSTHMLKKAWEDILYLYQWRFQEKAKTYQQELQKNLEKQASRPSLYQHLDQEAYIAQRLSAYKSLRMEYIDLLKGLLEEKNGITALSEMTQVKARCSNADFFCVLALNKASMSIDYLNELNTVLYRSSHENNNAFPQGSTKISISLNHAVSSLLEAQEAIAYAEKLEIKSGFASSAYQQMNDLRMKRSQSQRSLQARYGDKYQKRKQKTLLLYRKGKEANHFRSRLDAANKLADDVIQLSKELNMQPLKIGSDVKTIYGWLTKEDQKTKH